MSGIDAALENALTSSTALKLLSGKISSFLISKKYADI